MDAAHSYIISEYNQNDLPSFVSHLKNSIRQPSAERLIIAKLLEKLGVAFLFQLEYIILFVEAGLFFRQSLISLRI